MKKLLLLTLLVALTLPTLHAQKNKLVDRRDQAEGWYLPVRGEVMANGKKERDYELLVYKGSERLGAVSVDKKGAFLIDLDIDQTYMLRIRKPGFEDKLVLIDTSLPKDLTTYPDYLCYVNLVPEGAAKLGDPFYLDFPSAIVRWNSEMGGFYHSERYLDHIQANTAMESQATF